MLPVARVMIGRPRLALIMGLTPMIVADIFAIIAEMKQAGAMVLLLEQSVHGALAVADRFNAIERGAVICAGDAASEADKARLMDAIAV
jgi:branched-chain amino acid transport system ATP-binding protein